MTDFDLAARLVVMLQQEGLTANLRANNPRVVHVVQDGHAAQYAVSNGKLEFPWSSQGFDEEALDTLDDKVEEAFANIER